MKTFDVYSRYDIELIKAQGCYIWDKQDNKYLDMYGGHAVISIGHNHPYYVKMIKEQLDNLAFYSNSIQIPLQQSLANKLGQLSNLDDYALFLVNSGAEANENALKLASFYTDKKKFITFKGAFHGRTSLALGATDNPNIKAPINLNDNIIRIDLNDIKALENAMDKSIAGIIIEGIQGISGIYEPTKDFLAKVKELCEYNNSVLILDEIQSGYGRSGKFFAHEHYGIKADIISIAKGMGNGFPMGAILISPKFQAKKGLLGSTFGGSYLACAAGLAVLRILQKENLIQNAKLIGDYLIQELKQIQQIKEIRGKGLMIGVDFGFCIKNIRSKLLFEHKIFVGNSHNPNTIRILPPLSINKNQAHYFISSLKNVLLK